MKLNNQTNTKEINRETKQENKTAAWQYIATLAASISAAVSIVCLGYLHDTRSNQQQIQQRIEQLEESRSELKRKAKPRLEAFYTKEQQCLEEVIFFEIRQGDTKAMHNVADVVLNRTKEKNFPDTVCKVIEQPKQFSYRNGLKPPKNWQQTVFKLGGEDAIALLKIKEIAKEKIQHGSSNEKILWYTTHNTRRTWMKNLSLVHKDSWHKFFAKA